MNVSSPCVRLCELDGQGLCRGRFRQLNEIARWLRMSDQEKAAVNLAAAERRRIYHPNESSDG